MMTKKPLLLRLVSTQSQGRVQKIIGWLALPGMCVLAIIAVNGIISYPQYLLAVKPDGVLTRSLRNLIAKVGALPVYLGYLLLVFCWVGLGLEWLKVRRFRSDNIQVKDATSEQANP